MTMEDRVVLITGSTDGIGKETANCLHPGVVTTKLLETGWGWTGVSLAQGASLSVTLASAPGMERLSGEYFERPSPERASPKAYDAKLRRKLWDLSAQLTDVPANSP